MADAKSFRSMLGLGPTPVSPQSSTLIIIDAQNEYATGALKTADITSTRAAIASLLVHYRAHAPASHIVHITHTTPAGAPVFTPGTPLAAEFDELAPAAGEAVLAKEQPGAFTGTQLGAHLGGLGDAGRTLVLCGYMAHVCVSTTARQAAERGMAVVVARGAVGDRDIPGARAAEVVEGSLRELADAFADVKPVAEITASA